MRLNGAQIIDRGNGDEVFDPERFSAILSHEIESSLLVASKYAEMLRDAPAGLDEEQADHLDRITRAVERMQRLTTSVRQWTRADAELLMLDRVPLDDVLDEVLETLAPVIDEREAVVLRDSELPVVVGDRGQLGELLQNLISNAVKFGPRHGGRVTVTAQRGPGMWRIAVSDQGPGISKDDHERIFEPFRRLRGTGHLPGTGLGLAIARKIAENHGGRLTVRSRFGGGATFAFTVADALRSAGWRRELTVHHASA
jgi:signal transduction histidine kinase